MGSSAKEAAAGSLAKRLAKFDGKSTELLESLMLGLDFSPTLGNELVALARSPQHNLAVGATWLLKAFLEAGRRLESGQVANLARSLDEIEEPWTRLHLCQSMRFIDVPSRSQRAFARFFERCFLSDHKLLRAWSLDAFWRLALQYERYLARAVELLRQGERDSAASVRARARHVRKEADRLGLGGLAS